jgi:bifunctional UDP-N-acetylglucosamine pyrophosphorylase / glucosamine-1-phosphate N-acetyltransferase
MRSALPKPLHPICGKPILFHILDALAEAGVKRRIVVVGHQAERVESAVRAAYPDSDIRFALQENPQGTGHAVQMAAHLLADHQGAVLVAPGDAPLLSQEVFQALLAQHHTQENALTALTAILSDGAAYGRIIRDSHNNLIKNVEFKDASEEEKAIKEVNAAVYVFQTPKLLSALDKLRPNNAQGEYYLTDTISIFHQNGEKMNAYIAPEPDVMLGVNTRIELADVTVKKQNSIRKNLMLSGVSMPDPMSVYVDTDVQVGEDTTLLPGTHLLGNTTIGSNCVIGPYTVITDATVGDHCKVGPFAQIRPGSSLSTHVKIGNFVEVNRSQIASGVSAAHLTYLGDATVGEQTNIGAGTITCNYDGVNKHRTTIGSDVFVGSHTTLIAPITIGDGSLTAAGSVITEDTPAEAITIARAEQKTIPGAETRRRSRLRAAKKD